MTNKLTPGQRSQLIKQLDARNTELRTCTTEAMTRAVASEITRINGILVADHWPA